MIQSGASFDIILKKKNFLWKKELNYVKDKSLTVDFHPGNTEKYFAKYLETELIVLVILIYPIRNFMLKGKKHYVNTPDESTLSRLVSTKRSYILKQTSSLKLDVCLSIYELLVDTRR